MNNETYPYVRSTVKGKSFFEMISEYWKGSSTTSNDRAIHRLCSLMRKMDSQSVFIEKLDSSYNEIVKDTEALDKRFKEKLNIEAYRFTFSTNLFSNATDIVGLKDEEFLSTAILINFKNPEKDDWQSYLQKAIVCLPKKDNKRLLNNYIHVQKEFNCVVSIDSSTTHEFKIIGTYFCQQNDVTAVCAHVALCMIINSLESTKEIYSTETINEVLGIDHDTVKVGGDKGLNQEQVLKVLEHAGLDAVWHDFFKYPETDYAEYIYRYMEGGNPSLLVFSTNRDEMHVVPVIGHTLNSDIWDAEAELAYNKKAPLNYRSASAWVDHFVIHDDNFGMYLCLPVDSLRKITIPKYDPSFRAYTAIAIVPKKLPMPAREAEWASASIIRQLFQKLEKNKVIIDNIWLERMLKENRPMVIRTLLVNNVDYINHLTTGKDFYDKSFSKEEIVKMTSHLPDHFYLSEISMPDLYTANKTKIIDVLYKCDEKPGDIFDSWIQIRLPGFCMFNSQESPILNHSIISHVPMFRKNDNSLEHEW